MRAHATLRIDGDAIAANTRRIAAATDAEVMAVVKADGFGHGQAALRALGASENPGSGSRRGRGAPTAAGRGSSASTG